MPLDFSELSIEFKVKSHDENSKVRHVIFNKETFEVRCSCQKFDSMGILCKHILMIFNFMNVNFIPKPYLRKRWMKNGRNINRDDLVMEENGSGSGRESEMVFVNQIMRSTYGLSMRCKVHENARNKLTEILDDAREQIDDMFENLKLEYPKVCEDGVHEENNMLDDMLVRNPPQVKSRGITNKNIRHWDDKSKKRKGKAKVDRSNAKGTKIKGQSSQPSQCTNSQEANYLHQHQNHIIPPSQININHPFELASIGSQFHDNQPYHWVIAIYSIGLIYIDKYVVSYIYLFT